MYMVRGPINCTHKNIVTLFYLLPNFGTAKKLFIVNLKFSKFVACRRDVDARDRDETETFVFQGETRRDRDVATN